MDLKWEWLYRLQGVDVFKYVTGSCLLLYVGWQWYFFVARIQRKRIGRLMVLHQRTGVFVPALFYFQSVQIGYGYLAALSWIFLGNMVVGAANPVGIRIRSRSYEVSWGLSTWRWRWSWASFTGTSRFTISRGGPCSASRRVSQNGQSSGIMLAEF